MPSETPGVTPNEGAKLDISTDGRARGPHSIAQVVFACVALFMLAACGGNPAAVATTSNAPSPRMVEVSPSDMASSRPSPSPSSSQGAADQSAETIKEFARRMAKGDPSAKDLTVPGTPVYLYAETTGEITTTNPGRSSPAPITQSGVGWTIGQNVTLTDFVMTPDGLIADASRNGVPISKIVAPGDGTVYTRTASESYETFTGQADFTVRAFRLFGDELQIVMSIDNQSSADAFVGFDSYVASGVQYAQGFSASGADAGSPTKPTVKRSVLIIVSSAPSGGLFTARPVVDNFSSEDSEIKVTVPQLG